LDAYVTSYLLKRTLFDFFDLDQTLHFTEIFCFCQVIFEGIYEKVKFNSEMCLVCRNRRLYACDCLQAHPQRVRQSSPKVNTRAKNSKGSKSSYSELFHNTHFLDQRFAIRQAFKVFSLPLRFHSPPVGILF